MKNRIASLLLMALFFSFLPFMTQAVELPQDRSDCSIELIVRYNDFPINDGSLTAVRVGYVADDGDSNYFFWRVTDDALIENSASPETVEAMEKYYRDNRNSFSFEVQTLPVKDGKVTFSNMNTGLYLIIQEYNAWGFSKINSFLVGVPYMEDGRYQYHITAKIKSELEPEQEPTAPPPTEPDEKLPQTGQLNWPVPVMTAAGLALFVCGWLLRYGRGKEGYEK